MDDWFYYDVLHRLHRYCNPVSDDAVDELVTVVAPRPGMRVLDIACGHGALLLALAERGAIGVGVDASPFAQARAVAALEERGGGLDVTFRHGRGEAFAAEEPFDVAMCIGASWIWDGWGGTLDALCGFVRPGGLLVSGEPYWIREPPASYLALEGLRADEFPSFDEYVRGARDRGLALVWMRRSTSADWDRYEMLQTASLDHFLREHPEHPDLAGIRERLAPSKEAYLAWGKDGLGFATWVWRVPGS